MFIKHKMVLVFTLLPFIYLLAKDKSELQVGGALHFNYNFFSWKEGQKERVGDFGYDDFRVNAKAKYKGAKLNAEYPLYSEGFGGKMLKQAWIGYDFTPENNLEIGLTQVLFGITQYNSRNTNTIQKTRRIKPMTAYEYLYMVAS